MASRNGKWIVSISSLKKANAERTNRKSHKWEVLIRKHKPEIGNENNDLLEFVNESKRQIESTVQKSIDSVMKWRRDTYAKIDVIQQHVSRTHNITPPDCDIEHNNKMNITIQQQNEHSQHMENMTFPSMPILIDDTSNVELTEQIATSSPDHSQTSNKIAKRRNTMNTDSPDKSLVSDIPFRKKSRLFHSSVIALSKNPLKYDNQFEDQTFAETKSHAIQSKTLSSTNSKKEQKNNNSEIVQKFLETRKLFMENQKKSLKTM